MHEQQEPISREEEIMHCFVVISMYASMSVPVAILQVVIEESGLVVGGDALIIVVIPLSFLAHCRLFIAVVELTHCS
jgi:hypothetical protein